MERTQADLTRAAMADYKFDDEGQLLEKGWTMKWHPKQPEKMDNQEIACEVYRMGEVAGTRHHLSDTQNTRLLAILSVVAHRVFHPFFGDEWFVQNSAFSSSLTALQLKSGMLRDALKIDGQNPLRIIGVGALVIDMITLQNQNGAPAAPLADVQVMQRREAEAQERIGQLQQQLKEARIPQRAADNQGEVERVRAWYDNYLTTIVGYFETLDAMIAKLRTVADSAGNDAISEQVELIQAARASVGEAIQQAQRAQVQESQGSDTYELRARMQTLDAEVRHLAQTLDQERGQARAALEQLERCNLDLQQQLQQQRLQVAPAKQGVDVEDLVRRHRNEIDNLREAYEEYMLNVGIYFSTIDGLAIAIQQAAQESGNERLIAQAAEIQQVRDGLAQAAERHQAGDARAAGDDPIPGLRGQIMRMTEELRQLHQTLQSEKGANKNLQQQVLQLHQSADRAAEQIRLLETQKAKLESTLATKEQEIRQANANTNALQTHVQRLERQLAEAAARQPADADEELQEFYKSLEQQNSTLEQQQRELCTRVSFLEAEKVRLNQALASEQQNQLGQLDSLRQQQQAALTRVSSELEQAHESLKEVRHALAITQQQLQESNQKLGQALLKNISDGESLAALQQFKGQLEERVDQLDQQLAMHTTENIELQDELQKARQQVGDSAIRDSEIARLRQQLEETGRASATASSALAATKRELAGIKKELAGAMAWLKDNRVTIEQLKEQLQVAKDAASAAERLVNETTARAQWELNELKGFHREQLATAVAEAENRYSELNIRLEGVLTSNHKLQALVSTLGHEKEALVQAGETSSARFKEVEDLLIQTQATLECTTLEKDQLTAAVGRLEEEKARQVTTIKQTVEGQLSEMTIALGSANEEIQRLMEENQRLLQNQEAMNAMLPVVEQMRAKMEELALLAQDLQSQLVQAEEDKAGLLSLLKEQLAETNKAGQQKTELEEELALVNEELEQLREQGVLRDSQIGRAQEVGVEGEARIQTLVKEQTDLLARIARLESDLQVCISGLTAAVRDNFYVSEELAEVSDDFPPSSPERLIELLQEKMEGLKAQKAKAKQKGKPEIKVYEELHAAQCMINQLRPLILKQQEEIVKLKLNLEGQECTSAELIEQNEALRKNQTKLQIARTHLEDELKKVEKLLTLAKKEADDKTPSLFNRKIADLQRELGRAQEESANNREFAGESFDKYAREKQLRKDVKRQLATLVPELEAMKRERQHDLVGWTNTLDTHAHTVLELHKRIDQAEQAKEAALAEKTATVAEKEKQIADITKVFEAAATKIQEQAASHAAEIAEMEALRARNAALEKFLKDNGLTL